MARLGGATSCRSARRARLQSARARCAASRHRHAGTAAARRPSLRAGAVPSGGAKSDEEAVLERPAARVIPKTKPATPAREAPPRLTPPDRVPEPHQGKVQQIVELDAERARELCASGEVIDVQVLRLNKAGLVVKFSNWLEGFVPVGKLSAQTRHKYREEWAGGPSRDGAERDTLVASSIQACVLSVRGEDEEADASKHTVVLSQTLAEQIEGERFIQQASLGDVVECYVKSVTHFGIFVKLGVVDALIHKTHIWLPEMAEAEEDVQVDEAKLNEAFKKGDRLQACIIQVNQEKSQISLSMLECGLGERNNRRSLSELAEQMGSRPAGDTQGDPPSAQIDEFAKLCRVLGEMQEITGVLPGPCLKSGSVAPEFQVLLSSKEVEGGYEVFARKGRWVQECQIMTQIERGTLKELLQSVSSGLEQSS